MRKGGRADALEAGAGGLRRVDRGWRWRRVRGRAGELLDDVTEVALVDVVDRRLVLEGRSRRWWWPEVDRRSCDGGRGFGDLVGKLVEMPQELIFVIRGDGG